MKNPMNPIIFGLFLILISCGGDSTTNGAITEPQGPSRESVIGHWQAQTLIATQNATITAYFATDGVYQLQGVMGPRTGTIHGNWAWIAPASVELRAQSCQSEPPDPAINLLICDQVLNGTQARPDTLAVDIDSAGVWHTQWLGNPLELRRITSP